jgi:RNA polymerase sigma factor for flagellar operon FliA
MSKEAVHYVDRLWVDYKRYNNIDSRNELIVRYSHLVKQVVYRLGFAYHSAIDVDDLISYGIIGLIDALEKYDPSKQVKFETYAYFRIRGAIIDELRKQDWVPRSLRQKAKKIERTIDLIESKLGRQAKDEEIAQYLSISVDKLQNIMGELHSSIIFSLDEQIVERAGTIKAISNESGDPQQLIGTKEVKEILGHAIDELPERENKIISLYYFDELTLKEIGLVLGISESRVSQLHTRALMKLKNKLERIKNILL